MWAHFLHFMVFDSKSTFKCSSALHSKQFKQQIRKTGTVGGDFLFCLHRSGDGERKVDSEPTVMLLELLWFSKILGILGASPMIMKRENHVVVRA